MKVNETEQLKIKSEITCSSFNCVYMLHCEKSGKRNISEIGRILRASLSDHRVTSATTGNHFNLPGHSLANINVTVLDKV